MCKERLLLCEEGPPQGGWPYSHRGPRAQPQLSSASWGSARRHQEPGPQSRGPGHVGVLPAPASPRVSGVGRFSVAQGTYTEVGRLKARSSELDGPLGVSSTSEQWVCAHLDRRLLPQHLGLLRVTRGREFRGGSVHHWALAFALHFTQDGNENLLRISETWGSCVFIILTCGLGPYRSAKSEQSISVSKEKPHKALRPALAPACHRAHLGEDK